MKILIKNAILVSMDENKDKIQNNSDILINNNKIEKIGKNINENNIEKIIDATNKVVMPGLINTHAHVPMSIFRETLDGYNLQDWLNKKIWPMEAKLTNDDIYKASLLTFIEMIKTGCTCINDMYFMTDFSIKAQKETGVRLQTTRCLMGSGENNEDLEKIKELDRLIEDYKNEELISFNVGVHGLYTTDRKYIKACSKFAKEKGLPVSIHFCENSGEVEDIKRIYNQDPIDVLKDEFDGSNLILAHAVKLNNEDIEKLAKFNSNVSIATCPVSNLKLGCGIAKISKMYKEGINISIGTDGQGSGSNLDLFESMKYVALLQKGITENPEEMPAYEVLKMATINGAKALELDDKIGSIVEGKLADIIIINMDSIVAKPTNDIISELVYNIKGTDVETTIVNGKILMENRKLNKIDENQVCKDAEMVINRIRK